MKKHSILIVGTNMMNIYNHRLELIKELLSLGYEVIVVAPHGGEEKILVEMGVEFIDTPIDNRGTNIRHDLSLLINLVKILRRRRPNVVLTFYTKTNIYGGLACRITHTPYIENITGLGSAVSGGGFLQKLMILMYRQAVESSSIVFFQNRQNMAFFNEHKMYEGNTQLLPGSGVCLERFSPMDYPAGNTIEFVFISRIIKEKGIEEYVSAAREIKRKYMNIVFHVAGPCDCKYEQYIKAATDDGTITYHGKLFDIRPLLKQCHCTVFPSYYAEGMANVLLESAASARPIITTNMPGCGETVEDGISGYVVKERDAEDLRCKLEQFILLTHSRKVQMGCNGRKKMEREFDRKIVSKNYIDAIQSIFSKEENN